MVLMKKSLKRKLAVKIFNTVMDDVYEACLKHAPHDAVVISPVQYYARLFVIERPLAPIVNSIADRILEMENVSFDSRD